MPPNVTIHITGINTTNSTLYLDNNNHPHHYLDNGTTVIWRIDNRSIDSITAIKEKTGSESIWSTVPTRQNNGTWMGIIKNDADDCDVWAYTISWAKGTTRKDFDPI